MNQDQSYTVGHVSRLCGISIQTLRYYDKLGLVSPSRTDPVTRYRYYSNMDILLVKIVQDLKALRFTLEEIGLIIQQSGVEGLKAALTGKKQEMQEELQRLQQTAAAIEERIGQLDRLSGIQSKLGDERVLVELKRMEDRVVAYERSYAECHMEAFVTRFTRLFQQLEANGLTAAGDIMTVYHEDLQTFDRAHSDLEVCIPIPPDGLGQPFTRLVPGGDYITGTYSVLPNEESCKRVYLQLVDWMKENGYRSSGPVMERYVVDFSQLRVPEEFIVELQIPVEPALTL